jgi:ATP-binding cassette subfamily B protein
MKDPYGVLGVDKNATDEEIIHALNLAQIKNFNLDKVVEQGGTNFSGGQKQRLCIARALLKKPKILILDDSTSAVDTKTDAMIRKSFREYIPETTKIIIAQRVASVEDADKILLMDGGKITAIGTHNELLENNEVYQEIYNSQNKGGEQNG